MKQSGSLLIITCILLGLAASIGACRDTSPTPIPEVTTNPTVSAGTELPPATQTIFLGTPTPKQESPGQPMATTIPEPLLLLPIPELSQSLEDTALFFMIDTSESMETHCQNILDARYQIPELFISFLSGYADSSAGAYIGPKVGWITYPIVIVDNDIRRESADFYTYELKDLGDFDTGDWYAEYEAKVSTVVEGFGYSYVLEGLKTHITQQLMTNTSKLVVVLITDGVIQFNAGQASVNTERDRIEKTIEELKNLTEVEVELIVIQLPCQFENADPANPNLNDDNRLVWNHLERGQHVTILGREENTVSDIVKKLIETDIFATLLPDSASWGFFDKLPITRTLTLDDWFINVGIVSPAAIKAKALNENVIFELSGQNYTHTLSPISGILHGLPGRPIINFPVGDCNQNQIWTLTSPREVTGFYIWTTNFGLRPSINFSVSEGGQILNNDPFTVTITIRDGNLTQRELDLFKPTNCYTMELFVLDEEHRVRFHRTIPLSEFNLDQPNSLRISLALPLESGPHALSVRLQIVNNARDVAIAEASPLIINAEFEPRFLDQVLPLNCESSNCIVTIPLAYINPKFYGDTVLRPVVFVVTRQHETTEFLENSCVTKTDPQRSNLFLIVDGKNDEGALYNPGNSYFDDAYNNLQVEFPQLWLNKVCGFNQVIIQWQSGQFISCDLTDRHCREVLNYELRE